MTRRVLLIGHVSGAEAATAHALERWPDASVDLLAYGRAPEDAPAPAAARSLALPAPRPLPAARFLAGLRRARYDLAVVAQPRLEVSRARGALLAIALLAGAPRLAALEPSGGQVRPVTRRFAAADAAAFVALQAAARLVAGVAARLIERVAARPPGPPAAVPPPAGRVLYLRTDLDLALAPLIAGGSLAHTDGIVRALERRGHAVELWATGELAGLPRRELPVLLRANVPWEVAELVSGLRQVRRLRALPAPAFVYQRHSLNNLLGLALARRWRVPLVLEANASEAQWREEWSSLQFPRLARASERLVLRRADRVAAVSENAAAHLRSAGAAEPRLRVVPNGVEVPRFAGAEPAPLPFPPGSFVVAFSGLFYPWHGVRHLAEAFLLLRARVPEARLLLVGDGEDAPLVRSILDGVAGDVLLTGLVPRDEVPGYLAAADVLVAAHAVDAGFIGSPIKVFEYMAAGRAIVATRVAQMGDLLRDRETALMVPTADEEGLAGALAELHADPALRERLGRAAQSEAQRLHSWDARLETTLR